MNGYKNMYRCNKINYFHLNKILGGFFSFNEKSYKNDHTKTSTFINKNIKYIAGPISLYVVYDLQENKKIYLFGDVHIATNKGFDCGSNDELTTIYLPEYLKYIFENNKDI